MLLAEACNTGLEPLVTRRHPGAAPRSAVLGRPELRSRRHPDGCQCLLVAAQNRSRWPTLWGGGDVASADGMRFVVPVRTVHAGPNPKYFGFGRGVTWYNLLSDQFTGLNGITVPGTLRDSLVLLAVVLEQQTELQPTQS